MDTIFETAEYCWTRTGECNRCGQCCIDKECPHFKWVNGIPTCLVYDKRDQECEECKKRLGKDDKPDRSFTHKCCINFPDHPGLQCLKNGKCGFKFIKEKK